MRSRENKVMSIAQQDRILLAIKRMYPLEYPVFALMDEVGLRQSEALALSTEDFTPHPAKIFVHTSITKLGLKSRHTRGLPLSTGLGNLIYELANSSVSDTKLPREAHSHPRSLLMNPKTGKSWTTQHLLNVWRAVLNELGVDQVRMLDLRHNSVIRRFRARPSKAYIAKILGHPPRKVS